jgi:hypothetical protein
VALALERHLRLHARGTDGSTVPEPEATQLRFMTEVVAWKEGGYQSSHRCPDCNGPVEFREGCLSCADTFCGWNKCD